LASAHADRAYALTRLLTGLRGGIRRRDDHRRRAVVDARRVPGRDRAVLLEPRDELRESLDRRVGADVLVLVHDHVALLLLDVDRHDLLGEPAVLARLRREAMAALC